MLAVVHICVNSIVFVCFYNCSTWFWNCSDRRVFCWFKKKLLHAFILIINNACVWSLQDIADNMSNWNMFIINCVSRCKQYKCSLIIWFITVLFEPHQFQSIKIDMHLLFVHMDFLVNKIFFNICFFYDACITYLNWLPTCFWLLYLSPIWTSSEHN